MRDHVPLQTLSVIGETEDDKMQVIPLILITIEATGHKDQ